MNFYIHLLLIRMIIICNYIYRFLYNINWSIHMRSTIVVTGAARGIGAAIAKQLLDQGYHVIGIDCQKKS
ncbi:hypothetical protein ABAYE1890 [Acinetobacter baumannii AYE]|nr:hypothetical protein ABAYE1890 [Acinetobacter baumannii AYE]